MKTFNEECTQSSFSILKVILEIVDLCLEKAPDNHKQISYRYLKSRSVL